MILVIFQLATLTVSPLHNLAFVFRTSMYPARLRTMSTSHLIVLYVLTVQVIMPASGLRSCRYFLR